MPASITISDDGFLDRVANTLYDLPGVEGVALGGSRAQGTNRPDSDWDLAVYYRDQFDPDLIRALGWPGQISGIGGWGPVFNGGGALTVDGQLIDVHYRDLNVIEQIHDDALRGDFTITALLFHQADLPSYILLVELGINQTLRGQIPAWEYPSALRESAAAVWWEHAGHTPITREVMRKPVESRSARDCSAKRPAIPGMRSSRTAASGTLTRSNS